MSDPRIVLAAERTLLAQVRTGIAMMGFGFIVARFGLSVEESTPSASGYSLWIGAALILLGVITNLLSALQHVRTLDRLRKGEQSFSSKWSLSLILTVTLAALGVVMTICLLASTNLN